MERVSNSPPTMREALEVRGWKSDEVRVLARALSCHSENDPKLEERLGLLAVQGLTELADWIIGHKRFQTVCESDISRLVKIFLEIRQEAPSVELLVEHFGISEARGRTMLTRMNYGQARQMKGVAYQRMAVCLPQAVKNVNIVDGYKAVTVDSQCLAAINDAVWEIMFDPADRVARGKYAGAEWPKLMHKGKNGAIVSAKPKMWAYIVAWVCKKRGGC